MSDLTALICDCCGGQIDRTTLTCRSYGTQYRQKSNGLLEIIQSDRPIRFINEAVIIPRFMVETDPDKAMEYSLHELAVKLAERILPLAEWVQEYDVRDCSYCINMRIGVAEPKQRPTIYFDEKWRAE